MTKVTCQLCTIGAELPGLGERGGAEGAGQPANAADVRFWRILSESIRQLKFDPVWVARGVVMCLYLAVVNWTCSEQARSASR